MAWPIEKPSSTKTSSTKKRLVIVGGAPEPKPLLSDGGLAEPIAQFIDDSDYVVRMNDVKNQAAGWIGRKTDMLAVSNTGKPAHRYATGNRIQFGHIDPPAEIFWAYMPFQLLFARHFTRFRSDPRHGTDFTNKIIQHQEWHGLKQYRMSQLEALQLNIWLLSLSRRRCLASTGLRAIWFVLKSKRFESYQKYFVGFGFQGWLGHAFDAEEKIVNSLVRQGKLQALQKSDLDLSGR